MRYDASSEESVIEPEPIPQWQYSLYPLIVNLILDPDFEPEPIKRL
jgi:hypothetical protein